MQSQYYQRLLLIALSFLVCVQGHVFDHLFSRYAYADLQPVSDLQPVTSPGQQPVDPLTPEPAPSTPVSDLQPVISPWQQPADPPAPEPAPSKPVCDMRPITSPGQQPINPPNPEAAPPLNYLSFPPPGSNTPSGCISPTTGSFPSGMGPVSVSDPPLNDIPPDPTSDSISSSGDIDPGVKKICESTDHPSLCLATVTPFLDGKSDVLSVLEVAMKASMELAKIAFAVVKRFSNAPGTPPRLLSILKDCKDSYDDALYNFENALNAFPRRDVGTMNTMLSAVITAVGDCDDEISELGFPSPVARYADKLTNMTSNCLAIASFVH